MESRYFYHSQPGWEGFRINLAAGMSHLHGVSQTTETLLALSR